MTTDDQNNLPPEVFFTSPVDGWKLALHRRRPHTKRQRLYPILMIHGLGSNRLSLDLNERFSIAQHLSRRGFDIFILELRGTGASERRALDDSAKTVWTFTDHVQRDVPAAVELVLELTRSERLHLLGHSMGGMLSYAYAQRSPDIVRSITTVGSPLLGSMSLKVRELVLIHIGNALRMPTRVVKRVPLTKLLKVAGHFVRISTRAVDGILINVANMEPDALRKMSREGITDLPTRLLYEFNQRILDPDSPDHPFGHENEMERIRAPLLALAGSGDPLGNPESVRAAVERVGSAVAHYVEFGTRWGHSLQYGHGDMLLGKHAPREVYPLVQEFIEEHDTSN